LIKKFKSYFNAQNNFHLFIIFLVFGISGSLSVFISKPFLEFISYDKLITNEILKFIIRVLIIFPIYQLILLFVAFIFGQFNYFWTFEKKFWSKFKKK